MKTCKTQKKDKKQWTQKKINNLGKLILQEVKGDYVKTIEIRENGWGEINKEIKRNNRNCKEIERKEGLKLKTEIL